jgi:hypothetical protein
MSRGALHMCGVSCLAFRGLDLGDLVSCGSNFPLGQE